MRAAQILFSLRHLTHTPQHVNLAIQIYAYTHIYTWFEPLKSSNIFTWPQKNTRKQKFILTRKAYIVLPSYIYKQTPFQSKNKSQNSSIFTLYIYKDICLWSLPLTSLTACLYFGGYRSPKYEKWEGALPWSLLVELTNSSTLFKS